MDFSPAAKLRVCFFRESDVSQETVAELAKAWAAELALYQIALETASVRTVERPGFFGSAILRSLMAVPLEAPCDRLVYLHGRSAGDVLYEAGALVVMVGIGIKLEVHGAVETVTGTRGYVKAKYQELFQTIFRSPSSTLVHEGYHLLGCGHALRLDKCYEHIRKLKALVKQVPPDEDFFPALTSDGQAFVTRAQVNEELSAFRRRSTKGPPGK